MAKCGNEAILTWNLKFDHSLFISGENHKGQAAEGDV
jgi:hypothetical protein